MEQEVAAATSFLAGYLPPPTSSFTTNLTSALLQRYSNHWHPLDPERGSAYRALVRSPSASLDQSIVQAAEQSGLTRDHIEKALQSAEGRIWLGDRWTLWVDPGCVSLRVERGEQAAGRDSSTQFIEIWGKLPESLRSHAVPIGAIKSVNIEASPAASSSSSTSTVREREQQQDPNLLSPTKRSSKAIQILPPPSRSTSSSFGVGVGVSSPIGKQLPAGLLASPLIIPPTPLRPVNTEAQDVFSPSSSSLNFSSSSSSSTAAHHRSPSPLSASAKSYGGLAPSPTGFPLFPSTNSRRSTSRSGSISSQRSSSNASSHASDSSDGEGSASDGVFSSTESLSSSVTSAGTSVNKLWTGQSTQEALLDAEFKYPSLLPLRPSSAGAGAPLSPYAFPHHQSQQRLAPSSPIKHLSPSSASRSLPSSPTKPRRRGTRGGSGQGSQSYALAHGHSLPLSPGGGGAHEAGSSISSMSSITSSVSPSSNSRTREQALAGTLTEHSGGKVGVLGGGVLLGLAGAKMLGNARGEVVGEAKRRGRERRRGQGAGRKEGAGGGGGYAMQPQPMSYGGGQWEGMMM